MNVPVFYHEVANISWRSTELHWISDYIYTIIIIIIIKNTDHLQLHHQLAYTSRPDGITLKEAK